MIEAEIAFEREVPLPARFCVFLDVLQLSLGSSGGPKLPNGCFFRGISGTCSKIHECFFVFGSLGIFYVERRDCFYVVFVLRWM